MSYVTNQYYLHQKNKHLKSLSHNCFNVSLIRRYIILNPNTDKIDELLRKYDDNYNRNYEIYEVRCLLNLLTTTDRVKYNKINSRSNPHHSFYIPKKLMLSKINQDRYYFSQIIQMRVGVNSSISHMTYAYYIKQPKSMGKIKLNQISSRDAKLINCSNRNTCHPLIRKYSNILFFNHEYFYNL